MAKSRITAVWGRTLTSIAGAIVLFGCGTPATPPSADAAQAPSAEPELIPRDTFFAQAQIMTPLLSPDGTMISAVMPLDGVRNFFVFPVDDPEARRPVTTYALRDVDPTDVSGNLTYFWTADSRSLVFLRDTDGDERHRVMRVDVETGEITDLTPIEGVRVRIFAKSDLLPSELLVGMDDRTPGMFDLYRLNVETGERTLIEQNDRFLHYVADNTLEPRVAIALEPTPSGIGLGQYYRPPGGEWRHVASFPLDGSGPEGDRPKRAVGFDPTNTFLRQIWSAGSNTDGVVEVNFDTGERRMLAQDPQVDIADVMVHPQTNEVQAWVRHFARREWVILDPDIQADMDFLAGVRDGDLRIESRSRDDTKWIVRYTLSDDPETFYLYDREANETQLLFTTTPLLEDLPLVKMQPIVTQSSDGFDLVSYYTLPLSADPEQDGTPDAPVPFVVIIHGGPSDERAQYAFSPLLQWFANRGYGTLYVNFRGSPGFGREFLQAQNGEWGRAMNRDIDEQVIHLIENGYAEDGAVAVIGGSYGGYSTLIAMTKSPGLYACGVSLVGPTNLETFLDNIPPEWSLDAWAVRIGDPRTEEGLALLRDRSPINFVDQVRSPIMIGQGANDRRVPQSEADQMVAALQENGVGVLYALYPDEGHGLLRQPNIRSFWALVDAYFGQCLGGRYEPVGDALDGSSLQVPAGADMIPGLETALASREAP